MTARDAAVEVVRLAVEELQPPGTEYVDVSSPPWLRAALASPANAQAIVDEVQRMTNEARRIALDVLKAAQKSHVARPAPQLGLFAAVPPCPGEDR